MSISRPKIPPEIYISVSFFLLMLAVSFLFDLPIVFPAGDRAAFVGVHYIYPLIGIALLGVLALLFGKRQTAIRFLTAMPCYALVLFAHFNFKLWIPHINPLLLDRFYWSIDTHLQFLVDFSYWARLTLFGFIPSAANFYMISFIMLFYLSFTYFAFRVPQSFGRLTVAVILQQSLGSIAYLIAPAIGPFIYQEGVNPYITQGQLSMLDVYKSSVTEGPAWLAQHGAENFTAGLAAMPSLHVAGAFLFLLFAWREARVLVPLFLFALVFIVVTSIASRWHYLIDLPVGALLAWLSYSLVYRTGFATAEAPVAQPAGQRSVI